MSETRLVGAAAVVAGRRGRWRHAVIAVMATGLLCHSASALETTYRPEVRLDGFRLTPLGNLISLDGRHEFHPKGTAGFGFDSNVFATEDDEVADGFAKAIVGFEGRSRPGVGNLVIYDLELDARAYFSETERNTVGGRFDLEWARDGINAGWSAKLFAIRHDEPLLSTGRNVARNEWWGRFDYRRKMVRGHWDAGGTLGREQYDDDGLTWEADERNNSFANVGAGWFREGAAGGGFSISGLYGTRIYDDEGRFNNVNWIQAEAAIERRLGDKTTLFARGGVQARLYSDDFRGDASYDDEQVIWPIGSLRFRWQYRRFSRVDIQAFSDTQDGTSANANYLYGGGIEWLHAFRESVKAGGFASYLAAIDSGAPAGGTVDRRQVYNLGVRGEMEWARGFGLRASLGYTSSEAEVSNDFDRITALLEGAVVF